MKMDPSMVRKRLSVDQNKLDLARRVLGTATDSETVDRALDLVNFRNDVIEGVGRLAGSKIVKNRLDES